MVLKEVPSGTEDCDGKLGHEWLAFTVKSVVSTNVHVLFRDYYNTL